MRNNSSLLFGFVTDMSREVHDLSKGLKNGEIECLNTGNIIYIRMVKLCVGRFKIPENKDVCRSVDRDCH